MKKKSIALLLGLILILSLTACGGPRRLKRPSKNISKSDKQNETTLEDKQMAEQSTLDESEPTESEKQAEKREDSHITLQFKEFTPIDTEQCSVTFTNLELDPDYGYILELTLENKTSDQTLTFDLEDCYVNSLKIFPYLYEEVLPGKKARTTAFFGDMKALDFSEYTDIEMYFDIFDSENYNMDNQIHEIIHLYPYGEEKAEQFVYEEEATDQILAEDENIKVVFRGIDQDDLDNTNLNLYILNKSNFRLACSIEQVAFNDDMVDTYFYAALRPGKIDLTGISYPNDLLKAHDVNKLEDIKELEIVVQANSIYDLGVGDDEYVEYSFEKDTKFTPQPLVRDEDR